jgi:hypothetical protein
MAAVWLQSRPAEDAALIKMLVRTVKDLPCARKHWEYNPLWDVSAGAGD